MKKNTARMAMAAIAALFLGSYSYSSEMNFTFDGSGDLEKMIEKIRHSVPVPEAVSPGREKEGPKRWTVMVFLNAKNEAVDYALQDLNEMEVVGSDDKMNVVVELGRMAGYSGGTGGWTGSRRYFVQKDKELSRITSPVVMDIPDSDMGDWNYLAEFVKWVKTYYPADKYILIISDHGDGWKREFGKGTAKGISYDEQKGHHIKPAELRMVFEKTGKIDILALDGSLMQTAETAYELKDAAEYLVASEETEPVEGYAYERMLDGLASAPGMDTAEVSKMMVDTYITPYMEITRGATQSSIRTAGLIPLVARINGFVDALITYNDITNARRAKVLAQSFEDPSGKDIYHFADLVVRTTRVDAVKEKGEALMEYLDGALVYRNGTSGSKYNNAFGLAANMPSSNYDGLMWAQDSKWDDLVNWIK